MTEAHAESFYDDRWVEAMAVSMGICVFCIIANFLMIFVNAKIAAMAAEMLNMQATAPVGVAPQVTYHSQLQQQQVTYPVVMATPMPQGAPSGIEMKMMNNMPPGVLPATQVIVLSPTDADEHKENGNPILPQASPLEICPA